MSPRDSIGNESNKGTDSKEKINYSLQYKTWKFKLQRTIPKTKRKTDTGIPNSRSVSPFVGVMILTL